MSTQASSVRKATRARIERIALGSDRAPKIMAVRATIARIGAIDSAWRDANVVARAVQTNGPAMPLTDWELMKGARERARAVSEVLREQNLAADLYVGLEGGFHSISIDGEWHTFLRGWAYATDGERGSFGMSPSIEVPDAIVKNVIGSKRELSLVIDEVAGTRDVRSHNPGLHVPRLVFGLRRNPICARSAGQNRCCDGRAERDCRHGAAKRRRNGPQVIQFSRTYS